MTDYRSTRTTQHEEGREQRVATFRATQVIWLVVGLIEALIALRVVFKMIGVNADNAFASFLYSVSNVFVAPFASLTGAPAVSGMVFEFSSIIAMIIYALIGWAIVKIVYVAFYKPRGPVSVKQTSVAEHIPQQAPLAVSQTTTTQTPEVTSQTTVTEHTNPQP
jgi:uncharacterized membrane protein YuzA (DUF378 family)